MEQWGDTCLSDVNGSLANNYETLQQVFKKNNRMHNDPIKVSYNIEHNSFCQKFV